MKQKSIILVRFPFTNQSDYKIRPAIIVSNENYNNKHSSFWIVPMTTKESLKEFEIKIKGNDIVKGSIEHNSFVRTDNIATVEEDLVLKEIGVISPAFFEKIKNEITKNMN